jgi:hypothetical protein
MGRKPAARKRLRCARTFSRDDRGFEEAMRHTSISIGYM